MTIRALNTPEAERMADALRALADQGYLEPNGTDEQGEDLYIPTEKGERWLAGEETP